MHPPPRKKPCKPSDLDLAHLPNYNTLDEEHILAPVGTPITPANTGKEMSEC